MVGLVRELEKSSGATVPQMNRGGGLGVRYVATDEGASIAQYAAALTEMFAKAIAAHGVQSPPQLMVEPGRSIAAPSGMTLYTVGTIKEIPGVRTYVAVDGGMSDNVRPVTYGARYEAFLPARVGAPRPRVVSVAGKHCEQGDVLVRDAQLPADVTVGDILVTPVTGAYAHSMASNYNKILRPAVVFVRNGSARVVVRRENSDDLVRLDES
jgi:diaminopimelate decarboxylase